MAFTDIEKKNIENRLIKSCKESWIKVGYKKTNVEKLCLDSGISKGSFYLFYSSKEDLFLDVLLGVQKNLIDLVESRMSLNATKESLADVLKLVYKEYMKIPFILETQTPDFIAFINKLSDEKIKKIRAHENGDLRNIIKNFGLRFKKNEDLVISSLGFIFTPVPDEQRELFNEIGTIDYLIDILVDNSFV